MTNVTAKQFTASGSSDDVPAEQIEFADDISGVLLYNGLGTIYHIDGWYVTSQPSCDEPRVVFEVSVLHPGGLCEVRNKGDTVEWFISKFASGNTVYAVPGTGAPDSTKYEQFTLHEGEETDLPPYIGKFKKRHEEGLYS